MEVLMKRYVYLSMTPEALISSMLPPNDFGDYLKLFPVYESLEPNPARLSSLFLSFSAICPLTFASSSAILAS